MNKSLIALAVAGAFVAPVAMADTTIYGTAHVSFNVVNSGSGGATANQVASNASAIGFKGSEDLGGGTSAIWQIESNVNLDNSGSNAAGGVALGGNDSFAGLSGKDWGTLILGQHDTPYKIASRGLDLFADTVADNRNLLGPLDMTNRTHVGDVVAYISPAMSGVTVAAAYVAGAEIPVSGGTKGSAYSLAALYGAGPINAALAYQTLTLGSAGTGTLGTSTPNDKISAWTLGGGYTMDAFTVNAQYEGVTYDPSGYGCGSQNQSNWYLAGKYNIGNDAVKLAYANAGKSAVAKAMCADDSNTDASQISVGYDHSLSKTTTVYALYTQVSNKDRANYTMGGYDGITANVAPAKAGSDPSVWSVGMKHSF